ncbi:MULTISPECIES: hypothetical protein [Bacillus cereus group]|uniref:hypothetical protein n=1 Tax=Bacillus cereus group TaxID=86661 RepID=UPI0001A1080D|nr:hypothetical protein bcere0029_60070 [Bacillus cereus AH1272]EEL90508.1 hypothetical protein bcere0030_55560 [Bacillus cereus AH1273]
MKILRRKETIPFDEFMKKGKIKTSNIVSYGVIPIPAIPTMFDLYSGFHNATMPFVILGGIVLIPIVAFTISKLFPDSKLDQFLFKFEEILSRVFPFIKVGVFTWVIYSVVVLFI